jgi:hypothetical protein
MLTSTSNRGEWSASRLPPPPQSVHLILGREGLGASLYVVEKAKNLACGVTPNTAVQPAAVPVHLLRVLLFVLHVIIIEPRYRSRYSDCLGFELPKFRSSSPSRVKNFNFSVSSRLSMGSTKPPIEWVPESLPRG